MSIHKIEEIFAPDGLLARVLDPHFEWRPQQRDMAMAVIPAPEKVNFTLLQQAANAETISLATENDFSEMFPDCDLGAMPPFGTLYGLDVYVSGTLTDTERIAFPAGTHTELLRMDYADFERLVRPRVARFTFLQQAEMEARG